MIGDLEMEQTYWLKRARSAAGMADNAVSAEARLAHLDLSGRYSIKAAEAASARAAEQPALASLRKPALPLSLQPDSVHYAQLESGARYLAAKASTLEAGIHLTAANRYYGLRKEAERNGE
jgi:hypothetical protein